MECVEWVMVKLSQLLPLNKMRHLFPLCPRRVYRRMAVTTEFLLTQQRVSRLGKYAWIT